MFWSFGAFISASVRAQCGLLGCDSLSLKGSQHRAEPRAVGVKTPSLSHRDGDGYRELLSYLTQLSFVGQALFHLTVHPDYAPGRGECLLRSTEFTDSQIRGFELCQKSSARFPTAPNTPPVSTQPLSSSERTSLVRPTSLCYPVGRDILLLNFSSILEFSHSLPGLGHDTAQRNLKSVVTDHGGMWRAFQNPCTRVLLPEMWT